VCVCVCVCVFTFLIQKGFLFLYPSGFGGLVVSIRASGTQVRGFKLGRSRRKNPQHAFLRRRSKAVCPMSQLCGMLKIHTISVKVVIVRLNLIAHFSPIIPPFTNRGLPRRLTWNSSADDGETKSGAQMACPLGLGASGL
jgi:hypothetical protein